MTRLSRLLLLIPFLLSACLPTSGTLPPSQPQLPPAEAATPIPTLPPTATPLPTPIPAVRIHQGEWALFSGDYERAAQEFQAVLASASDPELQAAAQVGLGRVHLLQGIPQSAVQALLTVVQNYPASLQAANAHYFLARAYLALDNPANAAVEYASFIQSRPDLLDAYVQAARGDALAQAGSYTAAASAYEASFQSPQLGDLTSLEVKLGDTYALAGDNENAVRHFVAVYNATSDEYLKAEMNYKAGQAYLALGLPEQAYARFQDSTNNYPTSSYAYLGLVRLVDDGIPVDELNRGIVDYYAGQYSVAVNAIDRYLAATPTHDATPLYYKALSLREMNQVNEAIALWEEIIDNYPDDRFWLPAWERKAYTYEAYLDNYTATTNALLDFVRQYSGSPAAPGFLFSAGEFYEKYDQLQQAGDTWERLINEYPSDASSFPALFQAGICFYRIANYDRALQVFQRVLVLASTPEEQARAYLWIGKTQSARGDSTAALEAIQQAAARDLTGYYSVRAEQILSNQTHFPPSGDLNINYDLDAERAIAETWMRSKFTIPADTNLSDVGPLAADIRLQRGDAFWELGLYTQASQEFESLRLAVENDPASTFRLIEHVIPLGLYRTAIFASRQILDLAGMDDASSLTAPPYFNHVRFGLYFPLEVLTAASQNKLSPLLLWSTLRQESLFEGFAISSAGARGLMQIMPATGEEIVSQTSWPPNYTAEDLYRPVVSITMGSYYLARWRDYFDGELYALAAYNGGPGNTIQWTDDSGGDPDLFVEIVAMRNAESGKYLKQITEFESIYQRLYTTTP